MTASRATSLPHHPTRHCTRAPQAPIYFSARLAEQAHHLLGVYSEWTNQQSCPGVGGPAQTFDFSSLKAPEPCVVLPALRLACGQSGT